MVWWQLVRRRVLSIGLVLGVGFLLLVSLVASAALAAVEGMFSGFMTQWIVILPVIDLTLSFTMTTLLFEMIYIYKYVPANRLPGATCGSVQWSQHCYLRLENS